MRAPILVHTAKCDILLPHFFGQLEYSTPLHVPGRRILNGGYAVPISSVFCERQNSMQSALFYYSLLLHRKIDILFAGVIILLYLCTTLSQMTNKLSIWLTETQDLFLRIFTENGDAGFSTRDTYCTGSQTSGTYKRLRL